MFNVKLDNLVNLLSQWDGNFDKESVEATIFSVWENEFRDSLFTLDFPDLESSRRLTHYNTFDHFLYNNIKEWSVNP